jgi:LmbE family N-acetylglucosaminyl deacetylase
MLNLQLPDFTDSKLRVLCLGAHCDDIELGCGGALLKLINSYPDLEIYWVIFCSNEIRFAEAWASANCFLSELASKKILIKDFRDGFLPFMGLQVKEEFEHLKQEFSPDLVFTHYRQDRHQDHRLISDLTWNTYRNHMILEYEIPKYDGDLGNPNLFIPLEPSIIHKKIQYMLEFFPSQRQKQWFTEETFNALSRLRGIEANCQYAEAFYARKLIV